MTTTWVFHLAMLAVDAAVLTRARAEPTGARVLAWLPVHGLAWMVLGLALEVTLGDLFGVLRLWCWGIFGHLGLVLAGLVVILRGRARLVAGLAALALELVALDAFVVEPRALRVTRHRIALDTPRPLTIAVLADIQTDRVGAHERRALDLAMEARPDLVVLPGDFVQVYDPAGYERELTALRDHLRAAGLAAPLGVAAVAGNVEQPHGDAWTRLFDGVGRAEQATWSATVAPGIHLTALSFADSFDADLVLPDPGGLHLVFGHGPDFSLGDIGADLLIAGHTHGGQIRIPGFGPVFTLSHVPRAHAEGLTWLRAGKALVVSRGVGMERNRAPRLRFFCPPEVVIVEIVPAVP